MRMFLILLLFITAAKPCFAQTEVFERENDWNRILKKAVQQNKLVYVDCYSNKVKRSGAIRDLVYKDVAVANWLKDNFVSIALKMDTMETDPMEVKAQYKLAKEIRKKYKLSSFPAQLFFAADGKLLHKSMGLKSVEPFQALMKDVVDPKLQYYTQLEAFEKGVIDRKSLLFLIEASRALKEDWLEYRMARTFLENYCLPEDERSLFNNLYLKFLSRGYLKSSDSFFQRIKADPARADSTMKMPGFAYSLLSEVVFREYILEELTKTHDFKMPKVLRPNWKAIHKRITEKYPDSLADKLVLEAQIQWYSTARIDWLQYSKYQLAYINRFVSVQSKADRAYINNCMYDMIFQKASDRNVLLGAGEVQKKVIDFEMAQPNFKEGKVANLIDTYANLLYKAGDIKNALYWQQRAIAMSGSNPEYISTLRKMENGVRTWK